MAEQTNVGGQAQSNVPQKKKSFVKKPAQPTQSGQTGQQQK